MSTATIIDPVHPLRRGHHAAAFFRNTQEQLSTIALFVRHGLAEGERCVCFMNDATVPGLEAAMNAVDIPVDAAKQQGALAVMSSRKTYRGKNGFRPQEMLGVLNAQAKDALADGLAGLRATGDMSWILQAPPKTATDLLTYEAAVNSIPRRQHCTFLCQYDVHRFPATTVHGVLRTHRHIVFDGRVCDSPFFGSHTASVEWMLRQLPPAAHTKDRRSAALLAAVATAPPPASQAFEVVWSVPAGLHCFLCGVADQGQVCEVRIITEKNVVLHREFCPDVASAHRAARDLRARYVNARPD